jgi:inosose dehydratase
VAAVSEAPSGAPLSGASIGINQILWANDDLPDIAPRIDPLTILDEMARLGYRGSQLGTTFPRGDALEAALRSRSLRIAEVYAPLPCTVEGPTGEARGVGRAKLAELHAAGGDVLVAALPVTADRSGHAARATAPGVPVLTDGGVRALADLLGELAAEASRQGHPLAFHPHVGTYVETAAETERLMAAADPSLVGLCLDVGHCRLAGGDPLEAIERYRHRLRHVHLKDVDPDVARRMRSGGIADFEAGLRERVFTELGRGELDLVGVLGALAGLDYRGWLVVEQDTTWRPPSESAAISRAVVDFVLRELPRLRLVA